MLKTVLISLVVFASVSDLFAETPPHPRASLEPFVDWFPADTETLFVANGPFTIPAPLDSPMFTPPLRFSTLDRVRIRTCSGVFGLAELVSEQEDRTLAAVPLDKENRVLTSPLAKATITQVLFGSRNFRPPTGLGSTRYEGAEIVRFAESSIPQLDATMGAVREVASRRFELHGHKIFVFTEEVEQDRWILFVTRLDEQTLVCATDQIYLGQLLARRTAKMTERALPSTLPEWGHVDTTAKVWGFRHYRIENIGNDPTTPRLGKQAPHDPHAIGITFHWEPRSGRIVGRYLSKSQEAFITELKAMNRSLAASRDEGMAPLRKTIIVPITPTVTEFRIDPGGMLDALWLQMLFGFGVYL